jgi:hypothetical protein
VESVGAEIRDLSYRGSYQAYEHEIDNGGLKPHYQRSALQILKEKQIRINSIVLDWKRQCHI